MVVYVNGKLVPEEEAVVSVFDRGFLYGDGLFETLLLLNGTPFRWEQHYQRLDSGAAYLNLTIPRPSGELRRAVEALVSANRMPNALLRLTLSRGVGPRGYSPRGADKPTLVMTLHRTPPMDPTRLPTWHLVTSTVRLPSHEPLAQFKTCNKLPQILARAQAEAAQAQEALLLNTDGYVVEAASSNLFWFDQRAVCTPPLTGGILPGVTRAVVLELCEQLGWEWREALVGPEHIRQAQGVFLSLSSVGLAEGASLDGQPLNQSPMLLHLRAAFFEMLRSETGWGLQE